MADIQANTVVQVAKACNYSNPSDFSLVFSRPHTFFAVAKFSVDFSVD